MNRLLQIMRSFFALFTNQTLKTLKRSEEQKRLIIETANDAFISMDSQGVVTDWNRQATASFGWSRTETVGRPLAETIIPKRFREAHYRGLKHFMETGQGPVLNNRIELMALHRKGHEFPIELTVWPIRSDKDYTFNAFIRDISERKKTLEALQQKTTELIRSNHDLEQFAYVASHDLQEPLRMIASFTGLLAERYRGKLDQAADEFIAFAIDGAKRMQELINDLLQYSRIGTKAEKFGKTDCESILQKALANLKMALEESGGVITHDPLPTLEGDEFQLVSLFQNLIGNAVKFRGKEKPQIHVSAESREKDWLFSVKDNGIGIDPQFSERIFVIFQRLHGRGEYPGTGIGLALCKKIAERHGGEIWVESSPGKGSTFWFTLGKP